MHTHFYTHTREREREKEKEKEREEVLSFLQHKRLPEDEQCSPEESKPNTTLAARKKAEEEEEGPGKEGKETKIIYLQLFHQLDLVLKHYFRSRNQQHKEQIHWLLLLMDSRNQLSKADNLLLLLLFHQL